ncbi:hypothetical protein H5410_051342 [Solanum commersonii]|uniref:Uncharacterized protein n=1 Tax=Solanum commersonii TaxID=4109 RepID=A0A9J5WY48_SOLCO|nr:hypothetical protein H5410_051342 [Solanum commersonii]
MQVRVIWLYVLLSWCMLSAYVEVCGSIVNILFGVSLGVANEYDDDEDASETKNEELGDLRAHNATYPLLGLFDDL